MALQKSLDYFLSILLLGIFIRSGFAQVPEVTTLLGTIRGKTLLTKHNRNISGFLGIPYAQPPIGEYRFSSPVAAGVWNTTLNATDDSRICSQVSGNQVFGEEDCLYLNVFTPQLPGNENSTLLPVMVLIHGGEFKSGSKSSSINGPEYLLDQDVLLVVPNFRLGPLGFLSTGDAVAPGNWGLKDIVLALQWVQDNIAYFGGDPDVVTIFGHGTGGGAVRLLTFSDSTVGLFHRYITQSGSALLPITHQPRAASVNHALKLGKYLGCPTDTSTILVSCLRGLSSTTITNTSSIFIVWETFSDMNWAPTDEPDLEGAILTDTPANLLAAGKARDLPWMVGVTRDEGISTAFVENSDFFQQVLDNFDTVIPYILQTNYKYENLNAYTAALKSYYLNDLTASQSILLSNFTDLLADASVFYPAYKELQIQLDFATNPQFFYSFEYRGTYSNVGGSTTNYGVAHSDELLYLFPRSEVLFGAGKVLNGTDLEMVDIMVELWTSFAIHGTPTATSSNSTITWEAYSSLNNHLRIGNEYNVDIGMEYSFHDERMQFWEGLLALITSTEDNSTTIEDTSTTTEDNSTTTEDNSITTEINFGTTEETSITTEDNSITTEINFGTTEETSITTEDNSTTTEETSTTIEDTSTTIEETSTTTEDNSTTTEETSTTTEDNSTTTEEISTTTENNSTTTEEISTTTENNSTTTEEIFTTTENNSTTTEEISTTTENNSTTTEEISTTTEKIYTTTEEIFTTTENNSTTTEEPSTTTEDSFTTTEQEPADSAALPLLSNIFLVFILANYIRIKL